MNVIARLEYELAYYDSAVHRFNHYTTRTLHRHARKRWSWEFEDFEKSQLRLDHWCRGLKFDHWGIDLGLLPLRQCGQFLQISTDRDLKYHEICRTLGVGVSIVNNCVFLVVAPMDWSQEIINPSYLKQQGPPVYCIFICIVLLLWLRT